MNLPSKGDVAQLLTELVGKSPQVREASKGSLAASGTTPLFAGFYVADDEEQPCAAIVVEFSVALAIAGALAGIPAGVILDDLKQKYVDDTSKENLFEVLNIASTLFNTDHGKHLRLKETRETSSESDDELQRLIDAQSARIDLEVTVPPCPTGRIVVLHAA